VDKHRDVEDGGAWLKTCFVPAREGYMRITRERLNEVGSWMAEMESQLPGLPSWQSPIVGSGMFVCGDFQGWRAGVEGFFGVRSLAAELHTNGQVVIMSKVSIDRDSDQSDLDAEPQPIQIWDEELALALLHQLALAGKHMERTGAGGTVAIASRIVSDSASMTIQHNRQHWWQILHGSRPRDSMEPVQLSCEATELSQPSRLVEWSSILGDLLVNCFGAPHLPQFEGGAINESMFNSQLGGWSYRAKMMQWQNLHLPPDSESE